MGPRAQHLKNISAPLGHWGSIRVILGLYRGLFGLYGAYIGIMENQMETAILG